MAPQIRRPGPVKNQDIARRAKDLPWHRWDSRRHHWKPTKEIPQGSIASLVYAMFFNISQIRPLFSGCFKGPRSLRKTSGGRETSFDIKSSHCKIAQVYIRISQNPAVSIGSILEILTGPMSPLTVVTCHVSGHPKNRQQHHIDLGRIKCPNSGGYLRHPPCGLPILVPHVWRSRTCLKLDPWTIITYHH